MELQNNNSKFFSYLIILIALFFIVFVTKAFFETTQQRWDTKAQLESDLQSAKEDLSDLNALNLKFTNNEDELSKEISKFTIDFDKDDIFSYVHSYVNSVNSGDTTTSDKKREGDTIIIKGINISDGQLGDLGMNEATVSVSARFSSVKTFQKFLNYMTDKSAKYTFYIDTLSYPDFGKTGSFQVTVPLKMYYK